MNVEEMVKVLAMEHYRRIMNDTMALLQYCQVFGFTSLEKALEDVVKEFMTLSKTLRETEGEKR